MTECQKIKSCPFFADRMGGAQAVADMMKRRYCLGAPAERARYTLSTGGIPVPADLFPNQSARADTMLRK